jgi:hypothetical protein
LGCPAWPMSEYATTATPHQGFQGDEGF